MMEYTEYKPILDDAMVDYVNRGGSTYYIGNVLKEYVFEYENKILPFEEKRKLEDKAVQAILEKKTLPKGIFLRKCKWHERKGC